MYYSGFADEAAGSIEGQIKATKELGWKNIECRNVDGKNLTDVTDEKFEEIHQKLTEAGISVNCFGSNVANWGKDRMSEEEFQKSIAELKRAIPRMQKMGTKMIRAMSFTSLKKDEPENPEIEKMVFDKIRHLVKLCEDAGVIYLHENCMNYGSMSWKHTLRMIEHVNSPAFKLVFDTGNPLQSWDRSESPVTRRQDPWEFYTHVREQIHYIHIKDGVFVKETDGVFPELNYKFPGEGDGKVVQIVTDLIKQGYDGGFSMEPHMTVVHHEGSKQSPDEMRLSNYVEYGRRFMALVDRIRKTNQ